MIVRIRHKGLQRFYETGDTRGINAKHAAWRGVPLTAIDAASVPEELNHPGFRLHALKGERNGQWAVAASGNWRLVFEFEGANTTNVDWLITTDRRKGMRTMAMHNPAHPGEVLRESCLKPLGLTAKKAAEGLGVTRKALSDVLNGRSGVSPEMAIRLEMAGWSTAESWLRMQTNWNLWQARQHVDHLKVQRLHGPRPT